MTEPMIAARIHQAFLASKLPDWAPRGACAELAPNSAPWGPMFCDDVAYRPSADYDWGAHVTHAMNICASCPVRAECLAYAIASEHREEQAYWAAELEDLSDGRRYGVYGGVPGRIRERFRASPDPFRACNDWFMARFDLDHQETVSA